MEKTLCFLIDKKELFLEINIINFDIPLFFVCIDDFGQRYLALCCDSNKSKYLVAQCRNDIIKHMLQSKITIKEAFEKSFKFWKVYSQDSVKNDIVEETIIDEISDDELPKDGACLSYINKEIMDYIDRLNG